MSLTSFPSPLGFTQYLPAWIRNGFRASTGGDVKNQDMIVHLVALLNLRGKENGVRFVKVRAHRGEVGNEAADVCFFPLIAVCLPRS